MQRRHALSLLLPVLLAGCGFRLRGNQDLPFATMAVTPENGGGVALELARYFGDALRPVKAADGRTAAEAVVDVMSEAREKVVVGVTSTGQVREFELRLRVRFRMLDAQGSELLAPVTIEQSRNVSFNEAAVLAKEAEEALLYRDMQSDIVQQLLRRIAALRRAKPAG